MEKTDITERESDTKNTHRKDMPEIDSQEKNVLEIISKQERSCRLVMKLIGQNKLTDAYTKLQSFEDLCEEKELVNYMLCVGQYGFELLCLSFSLKCSSIEILDVLLSQQSKPLKVSICSLKVAIMSYNNVLHGITSLTNREAEIKNLVEINEENKKHMLVINQRILGLYDLWLSINQTILLSNAFVKKNPENKELLVLLTSDDYTLNDTYQIYTGLVDVLYSLGNNGLHHKIEIQDESGKTKSEDKSYDNEVILFSAFLELLLFGAIRYAFPGTFESKTIWDIDDYETNWEYDEFINYIKVVEFKQPDDDIERWVAIDYSHFENLVNSIELNDKQTIKTVEQMKAVVSQIRMFTKMQLELREEKKELAIKESERNRIMANLSHSIKNMLRSVIDPLLLIKKEIPEKAKVIDDALKGTNLIREMVNAINLSYKTTLEDLSYDIAHHGKDSVSLEEMIINSLKYSIGNMFDFKYFSAFAENYFPKKINNQQFMLIKDEWQSASNKSMKELSEFINKNMFKLTTEIGNAGNFVIGDKKSSAIKLMILFQEIIFNAVKYSSYVKKESRFIEISLKEYGDKLKLMVRNSFRPEIQAKSTGVGYLVIENYAKVLGCAPEVTTDNNVYSITLEFNNLWREK